MLKPKYSHAPGVIWDVVDGVVTLCRIDTVEFFHLNSAGGLIWMACDRASTDDILASLRSSYPDESELRLKAEVDGFVNSLFGSGFLVLD